MSGIVNLILELQLLTYCGWTQPQCNGKREDVHTLRSLFIPPEKYNAHAWDHPKFFSRPTCTLYTHEWDQPMNFFTTKKIFSRPSYKYNYTLNVDR